MEHIIFFAAAFAMGLLAAIPVGPVQIEVARRSINGQLSSSFMVVLGAFTVDILYGVIAFFGIAPFLRKEIVMAVFWLAGSIVLLTLSFMIIRQNSNSYEVNPNSKYLQNKRWGFVSGVTLSVVNPMLIFWWLMGQRLFTDFGLIENFTSGIAFSFLAAAGLGLASYLILLSLFLYWTKKFITVERMKLINFSFGTALLLIAIYFVARSIRVIL